MRWIPNSYNTGHRYQRKSHTTAECTNPKCEDVTKCLFACAHQQDIHNKHLALVLEWATRKLKYEELQDTEIRAAKEKLNLFREQKELEEKATKEKNNERSKFKSNGDWKKFKNAHNISNEQSPFVLSQATDILRKYLKESDVITSDVKVPSPDIAEYTAEQIFKGKFNPEKSTIDSNEPINLDEIDTELLKKEKEIESLQMDIKNLHALKEKIKSSQTEKDFFMEQVLKDINQDKLDEYYSKFISNDLYKAAVISKESGIDSVFLLSLGISNGKDRLTIVKNLNKITNVNDDLTLINWFMNFL